MSKSKPNFRQTDVARARIGALKGGMKNPEYVFLPHGGFVIRESRPAGQAGGDGGEAANPWDDTVAKLEGNSGK